MGGQGDVSMKSHKNIQQTTKKQKMAFSVTKHGCVPVSFGEVLGFRSGSGKTEQSRCDVKNVPIRPKQVLIFGSRRTRRNWRIHQHNSRNPKPISLQPSPSVPIGKSVMVAMETTFLIRAALFFRELNSKWRKE